MRAVSSVSKPVRLYRLVLSRLRHWSVVAAAPGLQVSLCPPRTPPQTSFIFPKENAFNQSWVTLQTSEKRQECPSPSKGSIWTFLYFQLKREQFRREGVWGWTEERGNDGRSRGTRWGRNVGTCYGCMRCQRQKKKTSRRIMKYLNPEEKEQMNPPNLSFCIWLYLLVEATFPGLMT